jgi:hypothetical protein
MASDSERVLIYVDPVKVVIRRGLWVTVILAAYIVLDYYLPGLAGDLQKPLIATAVCLTLILGFTRVVREMIRMQAKVDQALTLIAKVALEAADREERERGGEGGAPVH